MFSRLVKLDGSWMQFSPNGTGMHFRPSGKRSMSIQMLYIYIYCIRTYYLYDESIIYHQESWDQPFYCTFIRTKKKMSEGAVKCHANLRSGFFPRRWCRGHVSHTTLRHEGSRFASPLCLPKFVMMEHWEKSKSCTSTFTNVVICCSDPGSEYSAFAQLQEAQCLPILQGWEMMAPELIFQLDGERSIFIFFTASLFLDT